MKPIVSVSSDAHTNMADKTFLVCIAILIILNCMGDNSATMNFMEPLLSFSPQPRSELFDYVSRVIRNPALCINAKIKVLV